MLIYGSKAKELTKETLIAPCQNCSESKVELHVFQKYAHIFWIPLFPLAKTTVSQCNNCKQVLKKKEMPSSYLANYENLKQQARTPIWTFSGLVLIGILITTLFIADKNKNERNAQLILTPKAGDVLKIKTKENQYSLLKIDEIQGDSVYIRYSQYETNKLSGLSDLETKGESAYFEESFPIIVADLKKMFDEGEIIDIERL